MLDNILPNLLARISEWAEKLKQDQWIVQADVDHILQLDTRNPSQLFNTDERPLVVAFFGGTGVGKSSLLNRLAAEDIARTGIERPTSREVTVYLHQSLSAAELPDAFPTSEVRIAIHRNASNQDVLWVDMPDFDSAEESNKDIVLSWLPFIDVLVYVVNPERYKDDRGWRLLLEHGHQHAWLFVMNHWDRGVEIQHADFHALLTRADLADPLIFRTDCNPDRQQATPDDFDELQQTIQQLAEDNLMSHLEQRGVTLKIRELQRRTERVLEKIRSVGSSEELANEWQVLWEKASTDIKTSLQWKIRQAADQYASQETRWFPNLLGHFRKTTSPDNSVIPENYDMSQIYDKQIRTIARDSLTRLLQNMRLKGMARGPLKQDLQSIRHEFERLFSVNIGKQLESALKTPGSFWHRVGHRLLGLLTAILPLCAMIWVAYRVVVGFYLGDTGINDYLGFDFAIHSLLLIGLAWLIPYYSYMKSKPSIQDAVTRGLQRAADVSLHEFSQLVLEKIEMLKQKQQQAIADSDKLFSAELLPPELSDERKLTLFKRLLMQAD